MAGTTFLETGKDGAVLLGGVANALCRVQGAVWIEKNASGVPLTAILAVRSAATPKDR